MKSFCFHPEALAEADEAAAFYQEQQPDLEVRFLEALNDTISRIKEKPIDLSSHRRGSKEMSDIALSLWCHIPRQ